MTGVFGQNSNDDKIQSDSALVFISFIVELDGSITHIKAKKVECDTCNRRRKKELKKEAIRMLKIMPNMVQQTKRLRCTLPIRFD